MQRWLLPESIEDILPHEARSLEAMRAALLEAYRVRGFELVQPPLLEYVESLITGSGHDLDLRTFKLVDQLSGRMMGVRADITPQVARIDAHLLNRRGVARLCYCHSVLHTLPASLTATREPLQIGAEIYGHAGLEADEEVIRLMAESLALINTPAQRIDLGHVAIFRALTHNAGLSQAAEEELFDLLQAKDKPTLVERVAGLPDEMASALVALVDLYGGPEVLERARRVLPAMPEIATALDDLGALLAAMKDLPVSVDLGDLRGYHYHSGVVFAAYVQSHPAAVALGGRYDDIGRVFGRARPATGFSLDLREVARIAPQPVARGAVLAPRLDDAALATEIARLRAEGTVVVTELPGHEGSWDEAGCAFRLVLEGGRWKCVAL